MRRAASRDTRAGRRRRSTASTTSSTPSVAPAAQRVAHLLEPSSRCSRYVGRDRDDVGEHRSVARAAPSASPSRVERAQPLSERGSRRAGRPGARPPSMPRPSTVSPVSSAAVGRRARNDSESPCGPGVATHLDARAADLDDVAVDAAPRRRADAPGRARPPARRPARANSARALGVVGVPVGEQDQRDPAPVDRRHDASRCARVGRARVDHDDRRRAGLAQHPGVRAVERHRPGVRREHADGALGHGSAGPRPAVAERHDGPLTTGPRAPTPSVSLAVRLPDAVDDPRVRSCTQVPRRPRRRRRGTARGSSGTTSTSRTAASASAAVACSASSVERRDGRRQHRHRASAVRRRARRAGRHHADAVGLAVDLARLAGPSGSAATKKRASKRRSSTSGVTQCANGTSAASSTAQPAARQQVGERAPPVERARRGRPRAVVADGARRRRRRRAARRTPRTSRARRPTSSARRVVARDAAPRRASRSARPGDAARRESRPRPRRRGRRACRRRTPSTSCAA